MSVRQYMLGCCCVTDGTDEDIGSPRVSYQPFTNETVDHQSKKDIQSIELAVLGPKETGLKCHKGQPDERPDTEGGRPWRDEDLCFKHRRVVYCRRASLSMTNLFDPLQMEEETNQSLSAAQKRCTYPPSRTKNGMNMFAGHNALETYRKLESDTDSSSKDSLSTSSSCETESLSTKGDEEPEVVLRNKPEQSIDRNCHANKGYVCVKSRIPEAELPKLDSNCPLCKAAGKDRKESEVKLNI